MSAIPHWLIAGSTNSGKSILLKLILYQAIRQSAIVYIADFKFGVDWLPVWHEKCNILTKNARWSWLLHSIEIDTRGAFKAHIHYLGQIFLISKEWLIDYVMSDHYENFKHSLKAQI